MKDARGRKAINPVHRAVYEFFGSQEDAAIALEVSRQTFYTWAKNGIPVCRCIQINHLSKGKFSIKYLKRW